MFNHFAWLPCCLLKAAFLSHYRTSIVTEQTTATRLCPLSGETFFIGWGASIVFVSQQKRGLRADGASRSDNTHCMKETYSPTNNQDSDQSQSHLETNPDNHHKVKRGRPPKPDCEQRLYPVKVYFDHDSIMAIDELVARTGKSRSTIVYEIVLNGSVKEPLTTEQTGYIRKLAGMSNNLNQLAHEAHVDNNEDLAKRNHDAADKIDALIDKLGDL